METIDVVVVGGGAAGMSAAIECAKKDKSVLLLEKDVECGGILNQCIHTGFGLHTFQEELSGPSYSEKVLQELKKYPIDVCCNAMVTSIEHHIVTYSHQEKGIQQVRAKAIILAMGAYERTSGAIGIVGDRPSGVMTAGLAQYYLNKEGFHVGKNIFILGSGDIGLIMARRLTLEGAHVVGVAELMPYSNGLARNIQQCLVDFSIPLYLSHTVTKIIGKHHLEAIEISEVDASLQPIKGSEKRMDVDTLLLSVGLIPETSLCNDVILHPTRRSAIVDESYRTSVEGLFVCGNGLHIHDLVDFVSEEGSSCGKACVAYLNGELKNNPIDCKHNDLISYCVPNKVTIENIKQLQLYFRVKKPLQQAIIKVYCDDEVVYNKKKLALNPSEMEKIVLDKSLLENCKKEIMIEVSTW